MPNRTELAAEIFRVSHLTGTFTLRSGAVSHEYFDKYLFESDPVLVKSIAEALADLVPAEWKQGVAVARNDEIVPRATWATTPVADGDAIEIVRPVQGG